MTVRISPSGPPVVPASITSQIVNDSTVEGATASDALDTVSDDITLLENGYFFEQFLGGPSTNTTTADAGLFGDRRWSFFSSGGSLARPTDAADYIGAYSVVATASNASALILSSAVIPAAGSAYRVSNFSIVELLGVPDIGDSAGAFGAYRFGFGSDPTGANFGSNGLFFEVDRAISNNWRVLSRVGGVAVATLASSIAYSPHTLARLRAVRSASAWSFTVDGVSIGSIPIASIPTALVVLGCQVTATADSAQSASLDQVEFYYQRTIA